MLSDHLERRRVAEAKRTRKKGVTQPAAISTSFVKSLPLKHAVRCVLAVDDTIWVGSRDGSVHIRDAGSGSLITTLSASTGDSNEEHKFFANAMIQRGPCVWVGSSDGFLRRFDIAQSHDGVSEYKRARSVLVHGGGILCAAVSENHLWTAGQDSQIVEDADNNIKALGHKGWVRALAYDGVAKQLWSAASDGIRVWDVPFGKDGDTSSIGEPKVSIDHIPASRVHSGKEVLCLIVLENHVWSGGADGTVCIWDKKTRQRVRHFTASKSGPVVCLEAVMNYVWSGGSRGTVKFWDKTTYKLAGTIKIPKGSATDMIFSKNRVWIGCRSPGACYLYRVFSLVAARNIRREPRRPAVTSSEPKPERRLSFGSPRARSSLPKRRPSLTDLVRMRDPSRTKTRVRHKETQTPAAICEVCERERKRADELTAENARLLIDAKDVGWLRSGLEDAKSERDKLQQALDAAKKRNVQLQNILRSQLGFKKRVETENRRLLDRLKQSRERVEALESDADFASRAHEQLKRQSDALQIATEKLEAAMQARAQAQAEKVQLEERLLKAKKDLVDSTKKGKEDIKTELKDQAFKYNTRIAELIRLSDDLKRKLKSSEEQRFAEKQAHLSELSKREQAASETASHARHQHGVVLAELEATRNRLHKVKSQMETVNRSLSAKCDQMTTAANEASSREQELQATVDALKRRTEELCLQLETAQQQARVGNASASELASERTALKAEVKDLQMNLVELKNRAETDRNLYSDRIRDIKEKTEKDASIVENEHKAEVKALTLECHRVREELRACQTENAANIERHRVEIHQIKALAESQKMKLLKELEATRAELNTSMLDIQKVKKTAKVAADEHERKANDLTSRLATAHNEAQDAKAELQRTLEEMERKEKHCEEEKSKLKSERDAAAAVFTHEMSELREKVNGLKAEKDAASKAISALHKRVKSSEDATLQLQKALEQRHADEAKQRLDEERARQLQLRLTSTDKERLASIRLYLSHQDLGNAAIQPIQSQTDDAVSRFACSLLDSRALAALVNAMCSNTIFIDAMDSSQLTPGSPLDTRDRIQMRENLSLVLESLQAIGMDVPETRVANYFRDTTTSTQGDVNAKNKRDTTTKESLQPDMQKWIALAEAMCEMHALRSFRKDSSLDFWRDAAEKHSKALDARGKRQQHRQGSVFTSHDQLKYWIRHQLNHCKTVKDRSFFDGDNVLEGTRWKDGRRHALLTLAMQHNDTDSLQKRAREIESGETTAIRSTVATNTSAARDSSFSNAALAYMSESVAEDDAKWTSKHAFFLRAFCAAVYDAWRVTPLGQSSLSPPVTKTEPETRVSTATSSGSGTRKSRAATEAEEMKRQETQLRSWVNRLLHNRGKNRVRSLYSAVQDGLLLLRVLDCISPGIVDWKRVEMSPGNKFKRLTNNNYAVTLATHAPFLFSLVGIAGSDLVEGNQKLTLALVWQLMRFQLYRNLEKILDSRGSGGEKSIAVPSDAKASRKPAASKQTLNDKTLVVHANSAIARALKSKPMPTAPGWDIRPWLKLRLKSANDDHLANSSFLLSLLWAVADKSVPWRLVTHGDSDVVHLRNAALVITLARKKGATVYIGPEGSFPVCQPNLTPKC